MAKKLRPKHKTFADEWLIDQNGQKAAERAGYSPKYARTTAYKILQRPEVKAYIKKQMGLVAMERQEALERLGKTARQADSESVRLRALEKIIDVHDKADGGVDELILRVVRENGNHRSPNQAESSPPEAEDNISEQGETEGYLHG